MIVFFCGYIKNSLPGQEGPITYNPLGTDAISCCVYAFWGW